MQKFKTPISLYKLKKIPTTLPKVKIKDSNQASRFGRELYKEHDDDLEVTECCYMVMLNKHNNTIGYVKLSEGGVDSTIIDKILVSKYAVDALASGVILFHNHPSGSTQPSESDLRITMEVKRCLELFNISLIDHIILTRLNYKSMSEDGCL